MWNHFEYEPVVTSGSGGTTFKYISYKELWQPLCSVEQNHLCNFGRRHHEVQFCEIILNLEMLFKDSSYLEPLRPFLSFD